MVSQGTYRPTSLLAPSLLCYTPAKGHRVGTVLSVADHEGFYTASEETSWEDSGAGVPPCPHGKSGSCVGPAHSLVPSLGVRAFASHWESPSDPREEGVMWLPGCSDSHSFCKPYTSSASVVSIPQTQAPKKYHTVSPFVYLYFLHLYTHRTFRLQ